MTEPDPYTDPLWPDLEPCGCEKGCGHVCDPGFRSTRPPLVSIPDGRIGWTTKAAPGGVGAPESRGLTPGKEGLVMNATRPHLSTVGAR